MEPTLPSRRSFLALTGAASAALGLAACGSDDGAAGQKKGANDPLVFAGFGGTFDANIKKHWYDPFTAKTGVQIKMTADAPDPIGPIQAQVRSGHPSYDYMVLNTGTLAEVIKLGLYEKVDYSRISNADDLLSDKFRPDYGPAIYQFSTNMFWNKDAVKTAPESIKDIWDVRKIPGKRALPNEPQKALTLGLLADGVAPDQLYPLDLDRAFASLDRIRPNAVFADVNTVTNQIAQGDLVIGYQNVTRISIAIQGGTALGYNWNDYLADVNYYVPLKGTDQMDAYYKLVEYILGAEAQKQLPENFNYAPVTKSGLAAVSAEAQKQIPGSDITAGGAIYADADGWVKQSDEAIRRFNAWLAK